ncbi:GFA family protein [Shinella sumterensis]|uniref:CENP-V/GFA domain-containing protein n=1 Tax=Shinella sumterensis TaxID=1967501 RepID=A0AA50CRL7_9HYPH|nr:hypothetical protein [Shinella sumterensis]WLS00806.1 hypothetical protein Q9313_25885 [Shinella sumterensis]
MKRKAACSSGALSMVAQGDPAKVSVCRCLECQHRTDSTLGIAVFFARPMIEVAGTSAVFPGRAAAASPSSFTSVLAADPPSSGSRSGKPLKT